MRGTAWAALRPCPSLSAATVPVSPLGKQRSGSDEANREGSGPGERRSILEPGPGSRIALFTCSRLGRLPSPPSVPATRARCVPAVQPASLRSICGDPRQWASIVCGGRAPRVRWGQRAARSCGASCRPRAVQQQRGTAEAEGWLRGRGPPAAPETQSGRHRQAPGAGVGPAWTAAGPGSHARRRGAGSPGVTLHNTLEPGTRTSAPPADAARSAERGFHWPTRPWASHVGDDGVPSRPRLSARRGDRGAGPPAHAGPHPAAPPAAPRGFSRGRRRRARADRPAGEPPPPGPRRAPSRDTPNRRRRIKARALTSAVSSAAAAAIAGVPRSSPVSVRIRRHPPPW